MKYFWVDRVEKTVAPLLEDDTAMAEGPGVVGTY